ncbi:DUF1120 domain-containing protein [Cupriavidus sp. BIS7]|uniref:DUF1120 domain-containing protein n=1 Tax=Cupriavidus sp. BIS7 TaxID=1217718 RepID=UPI0003678C48|nr:DUF1120 domain-containing protein [Cupriavidus sp. BIS7]
MAGSFTPNSRCAAQISDGGVIRFPRISSKNLTAGGTHSLGERRANLTVRCTGPMRFSLRVTDEQHGTAAAGIVAMGDDYAYGAGVARGRRLGAYEILVETSETNADGVTALPLISEDDGVHWTAPGAAPELALKASSQGRIAWRTTSNTLAPEPMQTLSIGLLIRPTLNMRDESPISDSIELRGGATFTLFYL